MLETWLRERPRETLSVDEAKSAKFWPGKWAAQKRGGVMLRKDLEAAGIPYSDDEGRDFDFHALRHDFITKLSQNGVHPKIAQQLARHSKITLTMDHYTHLHLNDHQAAVAALPIPPSGETEVAAATGTDDADAPRILREEWRK